MTKWVNMDVTQMYINERKMMTKVSKRKLWATSRTKEAKMGKRAVKDHAAKVLP